MRSEDVPAESNAVSTSSSWAASQGVVPISDSNTQGIEWVPKRTRIVNITTANSFEAEANSVAISIPRETAPDTDAEAYKSFLAMDALYNSAENLEDSPKAKKAAPLKQKLSMLEVARKKEKTMEKRDYDIFRGKKVWSYSSKTPVLVPKDLEEGKAAIRRHLERHPEAAKPHPRAHLVLLPMPVPRSLTRRSTTV